MRIPTILLAAAIFLSAIPLSASDEEPSVVRAPTRWSYSTYVELQRAFSSVGSPKYTPRDRKILDNIDIGKAVFEYPGLIARGTVRFDEDNPGKEYQLTLGIKPRFAGENDPESSFSQLLIVFDTKGKNTEKRIPHYKW